MKFLPAAIAALASLWFFIGSAQEGMLIRELTDCSRNECLALALISVACSVVLVWLFLPSKLTAQARRLPAATMQNTPAHGHPTLPTAFSFQALTTPPRAMARR